MDFKPAKVGAVVAGEIKVFNPKVGILLFDPPIPCDGKYLVSHAASDSLAMLGTTSDPPFRNHVVRGALHRRGL